MPRDREGSFEPQVVGKRQKDIAGIEEKVLAMYAKGMSDRYISATVEDIYGFSVSHDTISRIVDRIQPRLSEWQSRPLEEVYPFLYVDAMMVKVKQDGKARNKAVYTVIGVDMDGHKDILGLWIAEQEGAHFWMLVFDELKARGVQDVRFVCIRRMVYTTNMVESVQSALRKVTRGKSAFPNGAAVLKALFLRIGDLTKKWTMPIPYWALVRGQMDILT